MKPIIAASFSVLLLSLSGCSTTGNYKVYGKCGGLPDKPDCEIGGEVSGSWGGKDQKVASVAAQLVATSDVIDAAQFTIDVGGSTIVYPASGTATLTLRNTSTGAVVATRDFGWRRSGNLIKLGDPDAVNAWALSSGSNADTLRYALKPFPLNSGFGEQRIAARSLYEGVETASSSSVFYRCTRYPSPYQCAQ